MPQRRIDRFLLDKGAACMAHSFIVLNRYQDEKAVILANAAAVACETSINLSRFLITKSRPVAVKSANTGVNLKF